MLLPLSLMHCLPVPPPACSPPIHCRRVLLLAWSGQSVAQLASLAGLVAMALQEQEADDDGEEEEDDEEGMMRVWGS